jgi:hypothetical protein
MISAKLTPLNEEELSIHLRASWRHEQPECDIADLLSALPSTSNPDDTYARLSGAIVGFRLQFPDSRKRSLSIQPKAGVQSKRPRLDLSDINTLIQKFFS